MTVLLTNHTTPVIRSKRKRCTFVGQRREPIAASIQRVDEDHANPKRVWQEMGQPEYLSRKDVERLEEASQVVSEKQPVSFRDRFGVFEGEFAGTRNRGDNSGVQTGE